MKSSLSEIHFELVDLKNCPINVVCKLQASTEYRPIFKTSLIIRGDLILNPFVEIENSSKCRLPIYSWFESLGLQLYIYCVLWPFMHICICVLLDALYPVFSKTVVLLYQILILYLCFIGSDCDYHKKKIIRLKEGSIKYVSYKIMIHWFTSFDLVLSTWTSHFLWLLSVTTGLRNLTISMTLKPYGKNSFSPYFFSLRFILEKLSSTFNYSAPSQKRWLLCLNLSHFWIWPWEVGVLISVFILLDH